MSSRLPGVGGMASRSLDAITAIPLDRWDVDSIAESSLGGRFGGFVDAWAEFDAAAFGVTPSEAALMDPQQRALLEVVLSWWCTMQANIQGNIAHSAILHACRTRGPCWWAATRTGA